VTVVAAIIGPFSTNGQLVKMVTDAVCTSKLYTYLFTFWNMHIGKEHTVYDRQPKNPKKTEEWEK